MHLPSFPWLFTVPSLMRSFACQLLLQPHVTWVEMSFGEEGSHEAASREHSCGQHSCLATQAPEPSLVALIRHFALTSWSRTFYWVEHGEGHCGPLGPCAGGVLGAANICFVLSPNRSPPATLAWRAGAGVLREASDFSLQLPALLPASISSPPVLPTSSSCWCHKLNVSSADAQ